MSRQVRSFGRVWKLERHLRTIPVAPGRSWRVYGQPPLRGIAYAIGLLALVVLVERLPAVGPIVGDRSFLFKYFAIPAGVAWLAVKSRVDGRPMHVYLLHAITDWRAPTRTSAGRRIKREQVSR